jgi:hypothetical protein
MAINNSPLIVIDGFGFFTRKLNKKSKKNENP